jgi:hypothetical protein
VFVTSEMGFRGRFARRNPELLMSPLSHKRTFRRVQPISALPPKADIRQRDRDAARLVLSLGLKVKNPNAPVVFGPVSLMSDCALNFLKCLFASRLITGRVSLLRFGHGFRNDLVRLRRYITTIHRR